MTSLVPPGADALGAQEAGAKAAPAKLQLMSKLIRLLNAISREARDTIALGLSRPLTSKQRERIRADVARDPKVDQALRETLAADPEFRRKEPGAGGTPSRSGS
jgi:hypothetical protein